MTALATIHLDTAILMAADSLEIEIDSYESRQVIGVARAQKLFLIQHTGTGISVSGYSGWDDKSIGQILREFVSSSDLFQKTQADIALGLCEFLRHGYPRLHSHFHLCGFDGHEPAVYELQHARNKGVWALEQKNLGRDGRVIRNILAQCEHETTRYVYSLVSDFSTLSIPGALALIHRFYAFEIDVVTRTKSPPDVGAPIDILILLPGAHWFESVKSSEEAILG